VAEVQAFFADGAMSLHTRSLKYGKLRNGQLVSVPPILIRRLKSHFCSLPSGVDLILGLNGYIWISKHVRDNEKEGEEGFDAEAVYSNQNEDIDDATRTAITRVSNIIRVLASRSVPITDTIVLEAYEWAVEQDSDVKDLLLGDMADANLCHTCRNARAIHLRLRNWFPPPALPVSHHHHFHHFHFHHRRPLLRLRPPVAAKEVDTGLQWRRWPFSGHGLPSPHLLSLCRQVIEYRAQDLSILTFR